MKSQKINEIIVVLVLLLFPILLVLNQCRIMRVPGKDKKTAKIQMEYISKALELFKTDTNRYPTTSEGLQALITNPGTSGWRGPYIRSVPKDLWRRPYIYKSPGLHGNYDLLSYGADGEVGGNGRNKDITNWEPGQ